MQAPKGEPTRKIECIQERLTELAEIMTDISSQMKKIADQRRGGLLALEKANANPCAEWLPLLDDRADRARAVSRKPVSVDPACGVPRFRYAQYVEFTNLREFLKFKDLPAIQSEDIARIDWADLEQRLMTGDD